ncbi:tRNA CCA-pyrophosphorylase [Parageobacillus genomosp. 1]|uniref:CCA-adding enzyme n=1 Tax=Parageobacillus genomosp. 1 TaxID=1295642 RepID=A0ABC9VC18_9BACL|nr:CCA tRNA nucleotidyltransferase [Parageobacillus genomosp. 1]EZP75884.1 tRNA CCA-pyrophosphorylase [Parageobacillus genomosp. 1]
MREPFQQALGIIRQLKQHGYEAYFVGGAVRDLLLGREIGDIDIATSALPHEVMKLFPKTIDIGSQHGTVVVIHNGTPYEVTTFRTDGDYEDHRRPESVIFVRSLYEDLKRRDFTMNAIAMDEEGKLIDPFGGQDAIKKQVICTVGEAKQRFSEDALRMMRAIRFVSQLGFSLAEETRWAIVENAPLLSHISVERMTMEFEKLLEGPFASRGLSLLVETGLFSYLPQLLDKEHELKAAAGYDWNLLDSRGQRWGLLCQVLQIDAADAFLRAWKLPNRLIKEVEAVLSILREVRSFGDWTKERLFAFGLEHAISAETVRSVISGEPAEKHRQILNEMFAVLPIKTKNELAVSGKDLIEWFEKPGGPWVKEMLTAIEHAVIHGEVDNHKERIYEWLMDRNRIQEKNY